MEGFEKKLAQKVAEFASTDMKRSGIVWNQENAPMFAVASVLYDALNALNTTIKLVALSAFGTYIGWEIGKVLAR